MAEPKLLASQDEVRVNEEALERRKKKDPSKTKHKITLRPFYCKGCGLCVDICPTGTLLLTTNKRTRWGVSAIKSAPDYCIGCQMCEHRCPDFAIFVDYDVDEDKEKELEEGQDYE